MSELLTAAQMRAIEQSAIRSGEVAGLELMERAGRGVVEAILEEWPELATSSNRAVVLCGPGNNGGDGFVVARLLHQRGWRVEVFLYGDPAKLPPDARVNYQRWKERGSCAPLSVASFELDLIPKGSAVVVDALFGTGLARPVELPIVALAATPEVGQDHRLVAVDIPSGLDADSGCALQSNLGEHVAAPADLTVTFHRPKLGHYLGAGSADCGTLVVVDIGLDKGRQRVPEIVRLAEGPPRRSLTKETGASHKYTHGHALILTGPATRTGAARLAARGALRIGAGLVTVAAPPDAIPECAAQLTAIMLRAVADPGTLTRTLEDRRINALCLGPGLGTGEEARDLVKAALAARRPTVLDADALTAFQDNPQELFDALTPNTVLTPHGGEFARLFPDIAERLAAPATRGPAYSKVDAAREAAARAGCVVLFKGPDTVIANPAGICCVNSSAYDRAAPWLATAGSGDVLAGFITGLLARGLPPPAAASTAAWLHVECARSFGPGLIAEDLPEELPKVFQSLGL